MSIKINIANKHCTVEGSPVIVCGNTDYEITFAFDEEWAAAAGKTARFSYVRDGKRLRQDVALTGDTVAVPAVYKTRELQVGVYAEGIVTTTPARIPCKKSIVCDTCEPDDLTPGQYEELRSDLNALQEEVDDLAEGGGGGGGGSANAVLYTSQSLTAKQQEQARKNIGAADAAVIGDIEAALDGIIALQAELIGGGAV